MQHALVTHKIVFTPTCEHDRSENQSATRELLVLCHGRDYDLARFRRSCKQVQSDATRPGCNQPHIRTGYAVTPAHTSHLRLVSYINPLRFGRSCKATANSVPRSPALIPKPADWASHLSVSGFFFLPLASSYTPPEDLIIFLQAGPPPVYIGFGSIVVQDPDGFSRLIIEAIRKAGVRALVSKGWGGLGSDKMDIPENVFMLGNCPHDWLFPQVSCVVHHGGAGTTAAGITSGRPTIIVPFFGDQPFWGDMIARAGAGPAPIPYKKLTADALAQAILEALQPQVQERAMLMAEKIGQENGVQAGAGKFLASLPINKMRCSIFEDQVAVWGFKKSKIVLSTKAAGVLTRKNLIDIDDLRLYVYPHPIRHIQ